MVKRAQVAEPTNHIAVFQETSIRRVWHKEEWWFSVVDLCAILTASPDAGVSWRKFQPRLNAEGGQPVTFCHGLKLLAPDGNVFLYPLVIAVVFVPLWPLLVSIELNFPWHKLKFWTSKAERSVPWTLTEEDAVFKVSMSGLVERLSRAEIEALEQVHDPLHAVPNLPFGHLNRVWQSFVDGLEPDCELWSFRGRWKAKYCDWQMHGYVARREETIGPFFLTAQRSIRET